MKYQQTQVKNRKEVKRTVDGKSVTVIRFKAVLRYSVPNPFYCEKPEGVDTRTASQKRKTVWREVSRMLEAEKVTKARGKNQEQKDEMTEANIRAALEGYRAEMEALEDKPKASGLTVPEAVDTFLDGHDVEGSTMETYRASAKHIAKAFDGVLVAELQPKDVRKWLADLKAEGFSQSVQGKAYRLLNLVLKHLVMDEELDRNVCDAVKAPKRDMPDPNSLTAEGREKVFRTLTSMEPTPLVTGAMIALMMGLREGEICALRWRDVSLADATLSVNAAVGRRSGGSYLKKPKTASSIRTLPIPEVLLNTLTARHALMKAELVEADVTLSEDEFGDLFVIGTIDGSYKNPNNLGREWKTLADALNLKGTKRRRVCFHDLRHTCASVGVANGTDVKSISSFLGHSSSKLTLDVYCSEDADALKVAATNMSNSYRFEEAREADVYTLGRTGTDN